MIKNNIRWIGELNNGSYAFRATELSTTRLNQNSSTWLQVTTPLQLFEPTMGFRYKVVPLFCRSLAENDIREVLDQDLKERVGLCIPAASLGSIDHDFAEKKLFLSYAYQAINQVLTDEKFKSFISIPSEEVEVNISELFHENLCFLVICESKLSDKTFQLDRYIPSLVEHGYIYDKFGTDKDIAWNVARAEQSSAIKIRPVSIDFNETNMVSNLLISAVAFDSNPILRFFFLYQIIELMIEQVYRLEVEAMLSEISSSVNNNDSADYRKYVQEFQNISKESTRISKLVSKYASNKVDLEPLGDACNRFLESVNIKPGDTLDSHFYKVRNFLFHKARDLPEGASSYLETIVYEFVVFLPQLLNRYAQVSNNSLPNSV